MPDPHDDSFCAINLKQDEWHEYQRDERVKAYLPFILAAFEKELIARMQFDDLNEIGFNVAMKAGTTLCLLQDSHYWFWASMAIAMLTHGRFEVFEEEKCVRFSKSPFEQEPMYYNNIEYAPCAGRTYLVPIRKRLDSEIETARASGHGQNDETFGISAKGTRKRDSPQQDLFSDLYESR